MRRGTRSGFPQFRRPMLPSLYLASPALAPESSPRMPYKEAVNTGPMFWTADDRRAELQRTPCSQCRLIPAQRFPPFPRMSNRASNPACARIVQPYPPIPGHGNTHLATESGRLPELPHAPPRRGHSKSALARCSCWHFLSHSRDTTPIPRRPSTQMFNFSPAASSGVPCGAIGGGRRRGGGPARSGRPRRKHGLPAAYQRPRGCAGRLAAPGSSG